MTLDAPLVPAIVVKNAIENQIREIKDVISPTPVTSQLDGVRVKLNYDTYAKDIGNVVIDGKKCVGILCEMALDGGGMAFAVPGVGINVNQTISMTFAIGSALAAASGIMWALRYPQIHPYMGVFPGFKAFIAAVFGGIGSIQGAVIGGLLLGFIEIMTVAFFPDLSGYRDAFAFILLVVVLLVKPTGLFGEKLKEKI